MGNTLLTSNIFVLAMCVDEGAKFNKVIPRSPQSTWSWWRRSFHIFTLCMDDCQWSTKVWQSYPGVAVRNIIISLQKGCRIKDYLVTGCTRFYRIDNVGCSQWWEGRKYDDPFIPMILIQSTFQLCLFRVIGVTSLKIHTEELWTSNFMLDIFIIYVYSRVRSDISSSYINRYRVSFYEYLCENLPLF